MDDNRSSRAETETALGCASREFHPSEDLSELPLTGQEYHAGAVIARQIGHDLLSGRLDPLPTLLAAFMQLSAQVDLRAPSNVAAHSLSLQGAPTDVFPLLDIHLERFVRRLFPNSEATPLTMNPSSDTP